MAVPSRTKRIAKIAAGLAGSIGLFLLVYTHPGQGGPWVWLESLLAGPFWVEGPSFVTELAGRSIQELFEQIFHTYAFSFLGAVLLVAGGLAVRTFAQFRVRDGGADPLAGIRALFARRPFLAKLLAWAPALYIARPEFEELRYYLADMRSGWLWSGAIAHPWAHVLSGVVAVIPLLLASRAIAAAGLRALAAPVRDDTPAPARPKSADEIVFSAVAVTPRTRAAVGALALASLAMAAWTAVVPVQAVELDPRFLSVVLAYVAGAAAAAVAFRRTSRIAVGIDGILVRDTFYAYRSLDDARARGADLELLRGGRVVLRLQMHGDDAGRRDEVLSRVREAIARAKELDTRGAEAVVASRPAHEVGGASMGAESYRFPSLSREQLWELVEGPTTDAAARAAAARALGVGLDAGDRKRMRIAASQCAEPRARVAIGSLLEEAWEDDAIVEQAGANANARQAH